MYKVSVIIPIYNKEKFLNETILSIITQTIFNDIELILINDGSIDRSETICLEYTNKYQNIKYFYQKNQGVSIARNFGLQKAKGKYVYFIDADDTINYTFLEYAYNNAEKHKSDIVFVGTNYGTNIKLLKTHQILFSTPWQLFIKKELLNSHNDIKFLPKLQNCEDILFSFQLLTQTNKKSIEKHSIYNYRQYSNSLSKDMSNPRNCLYTTKIFLDEISKFITKNNTYEIKQKALKTISLNIFYSLLKLKTLTFKEKIQIIYKIKDFKKQNNLKKIKLYEEQYNYRYYIIYTIFNILTN